MKKFIVDKKVFEKLPEYCLGIVVAKGFDNQKDNDTISHMLDEQIEQFINKFDNMNIRDIQEINLYRQAFKSLNINPNKFMCSIEALTKRVQKNKKLPHINPVVDLGNALSVKYLLPMGAHDIDKMEDNLEIRFSNEQDYFLGMGENEKQIMPEGELVYISGNTVKTRRWIWRQSEDGKITNKTTNIFFPIDGFENTNRAQVLKARDELADFLKEQLNCEVQVGYVNKEINEFEFN